MVAQINNILSSLKWPEDSMADSHRFNLGNSITKNESIKKILSLIETKDSRKSAKETTVTEGDLPLSDETKFYLFILIVNTGFDCVKGSIHTGFESMIRSSAQMLNIDEAEYRQVLKFYSSNSLYSDVDNSIYISPEKSNPLLKARGINIHFKNKDKNRVVYLKFFSRYTIYLAKSFYCFRPYNDLEDEIKIEEINIVNEKLTPVFEYAMFSF